MQNRDSLENFILENQHHFDDATPRAALWHQIKPKARHARVFKLNMPMAVAASILFLLTGAFASTLLSRMATSRKIAALERSAPDFLETERYYQRQIRQKTARLAGIPAGNPVLYDLRQLDQAMEELKNELLNAPKGKEEELISNLIQGYQMKISILELVLQKLEQTPSANYKNNKHETGI
ncbi:MAG: hypothetical protein ACOYOO_03170 [Saprospiraceae bacterium]